MVQSHQANQQQSVSGSLAALTIFQDAQSSVVAQDNNRETPDHFLEDRPANVWFYAIPDHKQREVIFLLTVAARPIVIGVFR